MNAVKEIRLALGMGQKEFALVLGIERVFLSLIELDLKSLPEFEGEKLEILKNIVASTQVDEELKPNAASPQLNKLRRKLALLEVGLGNCQKKLALMKSEFRAYSIQKRVLSIVLDSLNANSAHKIQIQSVYDALMADIARVSPEEQLMVQLRIDEISHSLVLIRETIAKLEGYWS